MYLRAAKTEAEDAGISTEGMAESVSQLRDELMALTGGAVDIMSDANAGTYKSTVEILRELSVVWDSLSDTSRTNITELIGGGVRNANIIASLMQNFGLVEDVLATSMDSAGSAMEENEKYLDSIVGKTEQFQAAFETLSLASVDNGVIKGFIDFGTVLTKIATFGADHFGGIFSASIIGSIINTATAIKKLGESGEENPIIDFIKRLSDGAKDVFSGGILGNITKVFKDWKSLLGDNKFWEAGGKAISNFWSTLGVGGKISTGLTALTAVYTVAKFVTEIKEKELQLAQETAEKYSDTAKAIGEYKNEAEGLIRSLESGTLSDEESYEARSRLYEIEGDLKNTYGEQAESLNLLAQSANEAAAAFDKLAISQAKNYLENKDAKIDDAIDRIEKQKSYAIADLDWNVIGDAQKKTIQNFVDSTDGLELVDVMTDYGASKRIRILSNDMLEYSDILSSMPSALNDLDYALKRTGSSFDEVLLPKGDNIGNTLEGIKDSIIAESGGVAQTVSDYGYIYKGYIDATIASNDNYRASLHKMEEAETSYAKAASGTYETIEDRLSAMSIAEHDIESAIKGYESLTFGEKESGVKNYFDDIASGLKETQTLLDFDTAIGEHVAGDKISTGMILITNALNSLRDASGEIDADHIRSIGLNISEWEDDPITGQQKAYLALRHALKAYGLEVENAIPVLRTYGLVSKGNSEMLGEATTAYTKAVTEQSAVIAAMKTTTSSGSIDLETYKGLVAISRDYANCLTIQNGAIKINRDALEKLSQERAEERLQTIESNRVAAEDRYEKNSAQINKLTDDVSELRDSYSSLTPELKEKLEADEATISKLKESNKEIAENIEQYRLMAAAVRESISAYAEWERAQGESQAGSQHKAAITGWKAIKDAYTKKEYGNTALIEGLEFLTGDDSITGLETSAERVKAIDAAYKKVNTTISGTGYTLQSFLAEGRTGANNFLNAVSQLNKEWASFDYATNTWTLDYDNAELAAEMVTTEDFIIMMNNLLELYGFDFESSQLVSSSDSIYKVADKMSALREFTGHAAEFSNGAEMFKDAIQTINDSKLSDSEKAAELGELKTMLDEWVSSTNQPAFMDISKDQVAEPLRAGLSILQEYQNVANKVASLNILGDAGMNVSTELNNAQKSLDSMLQQLASLSPDVLSGLGFDLKGIDTTKIGSIIAAIRSQIPALEVPIIPVSEFDKQAGIYYTATVINPPGDVDLEARYHVKMVGSIPGVTFGQTQASGTVPSIGDAMAGGGVGRAPGGKTLMGELGREMYVDPATNTWHTVGDNGAEFVNLPKNAIVFNHRQTASLLSNGRTRARGKALVSGNAAVMINEDNIEKFANKGVPTEYVDNGIGRISGTGPGFWKSSSSGSASKAVTKKFKELYDEHKHLLALEKESSKEYLDWLESAYKEAYERNEITLEDFRKYEEEVYELRKDIFDDYLSDIEHKIDGLGREDGNETQIINLYLGMIKDLEKAIQEAKDYGLDENDEYIQELTDRLYGYQDEIEDIQEEAKDGAKDAVKDLVDYRIDMLKKDLENEKESLNDKLNDLRDFYDKQKEMLQDARDEEEYIEEQSEKRKAKSDIEAELARLERDDSAWAQKRKAELREELTEAEKDLTDFEKDHALESAQDMLDKLYEKQEEQIESQIDIIDEKLNDPKALYNQALADIQNNTLALYEEMVAYNDKYGSGNSEDTKEMWDEAKESLDKYFSTYGDAYKGIILVPSPGGYASGTNSAKPGVRAVDELGAEYLFTSSDGHKYRVFSGGEKMLNAKATDFLYNFANSGGSALSRIYDGVFRAVSDIGALMSSAGPVSVSTGDIIVQGNADQATVSELRRLKRDEMQWILKEFNKMNRRT